MLHLAIQLVLHPDLQKAGWNAQRNRLLRQDHIHNLLRRVPYLLRVLPLEPQVVRAHKLIWKLASAVVKTVDALSVLNLRGARQRDWELLSRLI
jgi:hypothetical protein